MEKPDKRGKFRYVCYSSADYSRPDQSSPLTADFSWWEIPQIYQDEGFRRVDAVIVDEDNLFLIQGTEFISYNQAEGVWSYARPLDRIWRGLKFNDTDFRCVTTALKRARRENLFLLEGSLRRPRCRRRDRRTGNQDAMGNVKSYRAVGQD